MLEELLIGIIVVFAFSGFALLCVIWPVSLVGVAVFVILLLCYAIGALILNVLE